MYLAILLYWQMGTHCPDENKLSPPTPFKDSIYNCFHQVLAMYIVIAHHKNSLKHSGSSPLPPSVYHSGFLVSIHNPGYSTSHSFPIKLKSRPPMHLLEISIKQHLMLTVLPCLLSSSHPSASLDKWTFVEGYNCSLSFKSRGQHTMP